MLIKKPMPCGLLREPVKGTQYEGRQRVACKISIGEALYLVREPQNMYDRNAIMVCTAHGETVGYLDKNTARNIAENFDNHPGTVTAKVLRFIDIGTYRSFFIEFVIPGFHPVDQESTSQVILEPLLIEIEEANFIDMSTITTTFCVTTTF